MFEKIKDYFIYLHDWFEDNEYIIQLIEQYSDYRYTELLETASLIISRDYQEEDLILFTDFLDYIIYNKHDFGIDDDNIEIMKKLYSLLSQL